MPSKETIKFIVYIGLILAPCLFVALFIFEIGYHANRLNTKWQGINSTFDSQLGWAPIANRNVMHPQWGRVSSNSLGFRSEPVSQNSKHILIVGDSVVWGYGVSDSETMPHYLNEGLKPNGFQVHNLGVDGYGIDQYYLYIKKNIHYFKDVGHIVLVLLPYNDYTNTKSNSAYGIRKPLFRYVDGELKHINPRIRKYNLKNIVYLSPTIKILMNHWPWFKNTIDGSVKDRQLSHSETIAVISVLLEKIYLIAKERNAQLTIVLSPGKNVFKSNLEHEKYMWFNDLLMARDVKDRYLNYFESLQQVDAKRLDELYVDNVHFSGKGNKLFAETLSKFMQIAK